MTSITKAVFPVAGMGTRFLPATKASPKEMLPVVDKPLIQYAVEEAVAAGITELVFITGRGKRAIEDHFDKAFEVESELKARGKHDMLAMVRHVVPPHVKCIYVRQQQALGLGHAVLCALPVVGDHPFAVILADDLIDGGLPVMKQMVDAFRDERCALLGVQKVARADTAQYGIIKPGRRHGKLHEVTAIVEKPKPSAAPSTLAVVGRYILTPRIFHHLQRMRPGAGGEIQLTDGIAALLKEESVLGYQFDGVRYDCGSKLGYLKANVAYGLKHPEVAREFAAYLAGLQRSRRR
ncbi:MAG: UTP--glucose-1-phosphate uridylyltransferase GalU [Betaproteobacteria bacterium]|nr:UTP--glucose-1-phosphate uridylyltransferase GalU [Betaproteobacteria bacterium]MBI3055081.1 UTP--glucose-1-phosphate uridylyltransferase GalU [Betaproteobacteria bacterium]